MNRKFFIAISLTSALLTTMHPCSAMEEETEENMSHQKQLDEFCKASDAAHQLMEKSKIMEDSLEKANLFAAYAALLESNMPVNFQEFMESTTFRIAGALTEQAKTLANIAGYVNPTMPRGQLHGDEIIDALSKDMALQERVNLLIQARDIMRKGQKYWDLLPPTEKNQQAILHFLNRLEEIYNSLSLVSGPCLAKEENPLKFINVASNAITAAKESYALKPMKNKIRPFETLLLLSLRRNLAIYFDIISSNVSIYQEVDSFKKYSSLIRNVELLKELLTFFEEYLLKTPITINWYDEKYLWSEEKRKSKKTEDLFSLSPSVFKGLPAVLDPATCMTLFWNTYCGILTGAGHTILNLRPANENLIIHYQKKGDEHLDLAIQLYREKVYKEEYKNNPDKEQEFILARLASLAENEKPLKDFYAKIRQEHKERREHAMAQMIRDHQEEVQRQKEEKQKRQTEESKTTERYLAQQRAFKAEQLANSSQSSSSSEQQFEFYISSPEISNKTCPIKPDKVKTRPDETHPLYFPIEEKDNVKKDNKVVEIKPKIITLNSNNYYVFQVLIGDDNIKAKDAKKTITYQEVITLLEKGFSCKITHGGNHRKATAPNNREWTIPPKWDGPIPRPYQLELMQFLLEDMGINEGLLEVKEKERK